MKKLLLSLILLITVYGLRFTPARAENMSSDSYELQFTNLNMTSGSKSSNNYNILDTVGQTAPGQYDSTGYIVRAGFPYIKTIIAFAFTISDLSIDFGALTPSSFSTQTNTLTVSAGGAGGYSVAAFANHPLKLQTSSTTIPDTTCDTACDETTAAVWTNSANFGFGFNMSGNDIPADFVNSTYFRQFADASAAETAQIVMSSANVGQDRSATATYKVNISATQAAGDYENAVTFIATPGY
ncbi:MAG: hypothetical protein UX85_C0004G0019 [Candidatus Beckwithbacteria bacterium GW2011_GWB1_47_15]|uniref:Uncharacterized protein n=1 Tax=Candidatus Beckwithbacteria bacterium GW2011_GWB1_47_15 TaxID=1618371 RepID=A0A0G1U472_9BACT|nr:MAG: hypothetical protein UY43_C0001G0230 [Candidatus Beckwithbacteria bacterium GW2011_GWC1_49_16]KKU35423.1 MAG: hypothetical protein UX50_C0003G0019 [Candidatus Beckwithbacteria bacterium GW2011_GWA1_46_30]KKU61098.1 MAG: hypothetical protein UX85_C0004G0019 [Candidatus Beckwithbacteria bacterium GW2011_GWB1_47_15]KKU71937.1 MAG: hypothetical protein UX97_C0002G0019 [Candidatus Beckwithbacteria bacterium GW2011_GWA2_47_25]KKW02952.1 MAG: hypothetical protein UY37_C0009G0026 [Candidatus Be